MSRVCQIVTSPLMPKGEFVILGPDVLSIRLSYGVSQHTEQPVIVCAEGEEVDVAVRIASDLELQHRIDEMFVLRPCGYERRRLDMSARCLDALGDPLPEGFRQLALRDLRRLLQIHLDRSFVPD